MPHRLFIAIRPPEPVRDRLVDAMEGIEGARWVDEENLHLTLRFVGEVERSAANDLAAYRRPADLLRQGKARRGQP